MSIYCEQMFVDFIDDLLTKVTDSPNYKYTEAIYLVVCDPSVNEL